MAFASFAAFVIAACSGEDPNPQSPGGSGGMLATGGSTFGGTPGTSGSSPVGTAGTLSNAGGGGSTSTPGTGGSAGSVIAPPGGTTSGGGTAPTGGTGPTPAGMGGSTPTAGSSPANGGSGGGTPGGGGGSAGTPSSGTRDHCVEGYAPVTSGGPTKDGPAEFVKNGETDLTVQPEVIAWMERNEWQPAHFEWHSIRRCGGGGLGGMSKVNICSFTQMIPTNQECKTTGDGYEFLVMHRHMITALKQLFPQHTEQFTGWTKFPQSAQDVPEQWRAAWGSGFSASDRANAQIADEIDKPENLSRFPDEGAFGMWLQCFAGQNIPGAQVTASGLHGALHFKWVRSRNTDHGLGNQFRNIDNYLFWKMHGWIDNVWEKYRQAKYGSDPAALAESDRKLKAEMVDQCREMDALAQIINPDLKPDPDPGPGPGPGPVGGESGVFHTTIRPILESATNKCTGCHGPSGAQSVPEAGLTLGGDGVSSATIVSNLVNKPSRNGGQFRLVVPNQPDQSWLYLKASGRAQQAGCMPSGTAQCIPQPMPSTGPTMTQQELQALRDWIMSGAPGPTSQ